MATREASIAEESCRYRFMSEVPDGRAEAFVRRCVVVIARPVGRVCCGRWIVVADNGDKACG